MNALTTISAAVLADSLARHSGFAAAYTPWHKTPAARAAIAAVVRAEEQPTHHRTVYVLTADEWYSYEGPLAGKVCALWAQAYETADEAYRMGDASALRRWFAEPRPDAAIDAAFALRADGHFEITEIASGQIGALESGELKGGDNVDRSAPRASVLTGEAALSEGRVSPVSGHTVSPYSRDAL